jgi:TonB family protein
MTTLESALDSWVLAYLLNALWQAPLVFLAGWAAARLARRAGPAMEHAVWACAIVLEAALPACHPHLNQLWRQAWVLVLWIRGAGPAGGQTRFILGDGIAAGALPWLPAGAFAALAAVYVGCVLYFAGRLGWGVWTTEAMRRRAVPLIVPEEAARELQTTGRFFSVGRVEIAVSREMRGPATVGLLSPTLLLPPGFLDNLSAPDLDAVLAHEFAHMRRRDFAKNLLYGLISLPVAFHPALWLTRARLAETRELLCDAMAAEAVGGRDTYARSLMRLASALSDRAAPRVLHAIGIFDANIFERRIMHLTRRSLAPGRARRFAIAAACAAIALATCASALALRMEVTEPSASSSAPAKVHVKADALKLVTKVPPNYPVEAKKAKITGTVVLSAIIGKDGTVENLKVVSGPAALQQASLDAVRQWRYEPFLLNGEPVEVETTINIVFTLAK